MPYLCVNIGKPVDAGKKDALQRAIGEAIALVPGKTIDNTMIQLNDGCALYMGGAPLEGIFMDCRFYNAAPMDAKQALVKKLCAIFDAQLSIPPAKVYINIVELEHWGSGGTFR